MVKAINDLATSILGLINNITNIVTTFLRKPDLTSLFTTLAAVNNSTNNSQSCIQVEQNNFVNLLNNTSDTIGQCFNNYGDNVETTIETTFNLIASLGEIISNVTEVTTTCLQNENSLLNIPICLATPIENITQIVTHVTAAVQATIGIVGSVISNTATCIENIATEFLKDFFIIITTFTSCLSQII